MDLWRTKMKKTSNGLSTHQQKNGERGIALLLALFALVVVTSIGLGMMFLGDTETVVNANFRDEQLAYYAAKAGLEEMRDRMRAGATNSINASLPTVLPGSANSILYITNPSATDGTISPWLSTDPYFDDEICREAACGGSTQPSNWHLSSASASSTYAATPVMPYKWMRITLKTDGSASGWSGSTQNFMYVDGQSANASYYACWNGAHEIASSTACALPNTPVYTLTTLALTPSGARRILQYEVTQDYLNLGLPSAVTLMGPFSAATDWSSPGSGFVVNGNNPSAGSNAGNVPNCVGAAHDAMSAQGAASTSSLTSAATPATDFPGLGGTSTTPSVTDASSALSADNLSTVAQLNNLVAMLTSMADEVDTSCSGANLGSAASPRIVVVTGGSCNISGNPSTPGNGILVVTNTTPGATTTQLNFADNPYNGIILVIGPGAYFDQQSAKNTHFAGELLVANTAGTPAGTLGDPKFSWHSGAGTLAAPSIQYDSCLVAQNSMLKDYRMISSRELMY
jgi:hypothetical protein